MAKNHNNSASSLAKDALLFGRGRRTRTLNKGFGDPRVTITPCPYAEQDILYRLKGDLSRKKFGEAVGDNTSWTDEKRKKDKSSSVIVGVARQQLDERGHILHEQEYNIGHGILHKPICPYTASQNGKVERSHREDQKRFYSCHNFHSLDDFAKQLAVHNHRSNSFPMKPLNWCSPLESAVQYV